MKKNIALIILVLVFIGGIILLTRDGSKPETTTTEPSTNVTMVGDRQIVEITAKGGYSPRVTIAQANIPTIIRVITDGTYDCSAALTIPSIKSRTFLPPSGETDITIAAHAPGDTIQGVCTMGMYSFRINFK